MGSRIPGAKALCLATLACLAFCQTANAAQMHFQFSGVILHPSSEFTSVSVDQQWSAEFIIDSNAPGTTTTFPDPDPYYMGFTSGVIGEYVVSSGNISIDGLLDWNFSTEGGVFVANDRVSGSAPFDAVSFEARSGGAVVIDGNILDRALLSFRDDDALDTTDLAEATRLDDFSYTPLISFIFEDGDGNPNRASIFIIGIVNNYSVTVTPVPVPPTIWLMASALLGLVYKKRNS